MGREKTDLHKVRPALLIPFKITFKILSLVHLDWHNKVSANKNGTAKLACCRGPSQNLIAIPQNRLRRQRNLFPEGHVP